MILIQFVFLAGEILFINKNGKVGPAKHPHLDFSASISKLFILYIYIYILYIL